MAKRRMVCGGHLAYRCIGTMRVYSDVQGRRVYDYRCTVCGHAGQGDGRRTTCPVPPRCAGLTRRESTSGEPEPQGA